MDDACRGVFVPSAMTMSEPGSAALERLTVRAEAASEAADERMVTRLAEKLADHDHANATTAHKTASKNPPDHGEH